MDGAVRNLAEFTGCSLRDGAAAASSAPAAVLGDGTRGHLGSGARGDVVVLEPDGSVRATLVAGRVALAT
jgi:N-acetylglucosamine-6-phosphate deacetylase